MHLLHDAFKELHDISEANELIPLKRNHKYKQEKRQEQLIHLIQLGH